MARPRVVVNLYITCHERFVTRAGLYKFGLIDTIKYYFCNADEIQQHLLFECNEMKIIWEKVLEWIQFHHHPAHGVK